MSFLDAARSCPRCGHTTLLCHDCARERYGAPKVGAEGEAAIKAGAVTLPEVKADDLLRALEQLDALEVPARVELLGAPVLEGDVYHVPARLTLELPRALRLADLLALKPPPALEAALEQLEKLEPEELDDTAPAPVVCVGPARCRTCGDELITEEPATGDGQCIRCWQADYERAEREPEDARLAGLCATPPARECEPCNLPERASCEGCPMSTAAFVERISRSTP